MPGFVIHLAIAKEYLKRHQEDGEDEQEFYRGVIAPDLLKKPESHYGPSTSEPDFECYAKETGLSSSYERGYYLHLLTDKDFYLSYGDIFSEDFYHDYNKLNRRLIHTFQIQIPEEIKEIVKFEEGEPVVLRFMEMYNFIRGFAGNLKTLKDGPFFIKRKIEIIEARDGGIDC